VTENPVTQQATCGAASPSRTPSPSTPQRS
jgi:hypothetical protein